MEEDTDRPLLKERSSPVDIELEAIHGSDPRRDGEKGQVKPQKMSEDCVDGEKEAEGPEDDVKVKPEDIWKLKRMGLRGNVSGVKIMLDTYPGNVTELVNASEQDGWSVLHSVVRGGTVPVIQALIAAGADVNKKDDDGSTPLHWAAGYRWNDGLNVVQCLVEKGADLGLQDKYGNTPLHESIRSRQSTTTEYILDHPIANRKYIETKTKHDETALHVAAHFNIAVQMLLDKGADIMSIDGSGWTPLHYACANDQEEAAQVLIKAGRQQMKLEEMLQAKNNKGDTPLHLASKIGAPKLIKICCGHGADVMATNNDNKNPLHLAAEKNYSLGFQTLFDPALWLDEDGQTVDPSDKHLTKEGYIEKMKSIVGKAVTEKDKFNHNCLNVAIKHNNEGVAMAIVKSRFCREALMNPISLHPPQTPMRELIKKMPDVAEEAMTQCMKPIDDSIPDHLDTEEFIPPYNFIDDTWSIDLDPEDSGKPRSLRWKEKNFDESGYLLPNQEPYSRNSTTLRKNHPLILMSTYNDKLLTHKLVRELIFHKWDSMGRYVYYTTLFIYIVFLVFFTGFTLTSRPPYEPRPIINSTQHNEPERTVVEIVFIDVGRWMVIFLLSLYVLREVMEIYSWRANYFVHTENLIEWLLFITAILFLIDLDDTGIRKDWQWQLGAIAIFLAWINLVLFIRKLPLLGIYIVMVAHILKTFLLFSPVFALFVAAFAFSFSVLFKNQYEFHTVGHSLMKTFVMMIGELDFSDIFLGYEENPGEYQHTVFYSAISYIVFALFLVIMTIIIMNLLVGLAVDDIQGVQESAEIRRLAMQVELVIDLEFLVPHNLYRRFIRHVPTGDISCPALAIVYSPVVRKMDQILNPRRPPDPVLKAVEELQEQSQILQEQGQRIREQGKMIRELQERQEKMMWQLIRQTSRIVRNQEAQKQTTKAT